MPSGYEKSPDYGGRDFTRLDWAITMALFVAMMAAPVACVLVQRDATPRWRVIDGDTVELDNETWRLIGIDAPETSRSYGAECPGEIELGESARAHAQMLFEQADEITAHQRREGERDQYDRLLGYIDLDGKDFRQRMVNDGRARWWDYDGGEAKPDWCGGESWD